MTPAPTRSPGIRPPKVVVTKIGLDGHDRGSRIVATYLRDAGMEVVYTGPWQRVEEVVSLALEEDVDVIGISSLATDHLLVPKLTSALREEGMGHIGVVVGGIIPDADEKMLVECGVDRIFHTGASRDEIVSGVRELVTEVRLRMDSGRGENHVAS